MDKLLLLQKGKAVGEVTVTQEGLYTRFQAKVFSLPEALRCVYLTGEQGSLRLGIVEKKGSGGDISRRFSTQSLGKFGRFLQGEVRPAEEEVVIPWEPLRAEVFHSPYLQKQLSTLQGVLTKQVERRRLVAVVYAPKKAIPLMSFFCFAQPEEIEQLPYLVFAFDEKEQPIV